MQCILLHETDPNFCLATEEYLLKNRTEDIFMVWQSRDAVVVGKHQNALAEINYRYVRENKIQLARRISGGGTVFHDMGNVNFSVIKNFIRADEISFRQFTEPVAEALSALGIRTGTTGRNDLTADGKKISGNAEHIHKNRVLHHGTLLYSSDLGRLGKAISVVPGKYQGKSVQSIRSKVTNISSCIAISLSLSQFMLFLIDHFRKNNPGSSMDVLSQQEKEEVQRLSEQKYQTPEWQFGYSPAYLFDNSFEWSGKQANIRLKVERGSIQGAHLSGNVYRQQDKASLETLLTGLPHLYENIEQAHVELGIPYDENLIYSYF
jgi:lipoate-protein ligase A